MSKIVSGHMKRAIVRARKQLRSASSSQILTYGLNRYRLAQKQAPVLIVLKPKTTGKQADTISCQE